MVAGSTTSHTANSPSHGYSPPYRRCVDLPVDIVSCVLQHVESRGDLINISRTNKTVHACALPFLYRRIRFRTFERAMPGQPNKKDTKTTDGFLAFLTQKGYTTYVREIEYRGGFGPEVPLHNPRDVLRGCVNLRAFSWNNASPDPRSSAELKDILEILRGLPLRRLTIRTATFDQELWRMVGEFVGLRTVDIWSSQTQVPRISGWANNLQHSLRSLELEKSMLYDSRRGIQLTFLSELKNLRHLRIPKLSMTSVFEVLTYLEKLESLRIEQLNVDSPTGTQSPRTFLRHLNLGIGLDTIEASFWEWILQLASASSLETLVIKTASTQHVSESFLVRLADKHGAVLNKLDVGSLAMSGTDIHDLSFKCPQLWNVGCTLDSPKEDLAAALKAKFSIQHLRVSQKRVLPAEDPLNASSEGSIIGISQVKEWMSRADSKLRTLEIDRQIYTGRWIKAPGSAMELEVTSQTTPQVYM